MRKLEKFQFRRKMEETLRNRHHLGSELLPRSLATGGLASGLLRTSHELRSINEKTRGNSKGEAREKGNWERYTRLN